MFSEPLLGCACGPLTCNVNAKTPEERKKTGDPRKSIADRYSSRETYLKLYGDAVNQVVQQKYVLPEDRDALLKRGEEG